MSENRQANPDPLEVTIHAFTNMSVPQRPPDEQVLARLSTRRHLRRWLVPTFVAAGILIVAFVLFLVKNKPAEVVQEIVRRTEKVSAAFIKELMRRSAQFHLERGDSSKIDLEDVQNALEEMLFTGGSLNIKLLGAHLDECDAGTARNGRKSAERHKQRFTRPLDH